jgi:small-conductance mechanosensitive channel
MSQILDPAGQALGSGLPRILGALVLLVVGLLIVRLAARLLTKGLLATDLDAAAERHGVHDALERLTLDRSLSTAVGTAVRAALSIVIVLAALSLTGLGFLRESLNQGVLLLPNLLVALALLLAGAVLATTVRRHVDRLAEQMDLPGPVGRLVEVVILVVFGVTALAQIGVSTTIMSTLSGLVVGAAALAFALAFGLGNREVARGVGAGRVLRSAYSPGQVISVAGVRGEIVALDGSAVVLRTAGGGTARVPNHLLLESVVEIAAPASEAGGGA